MKGLEPSDIHCILSASGWLDLKNPAEARNELDHVSSAARNHPDVLEMRWMICEATNDWPGALAAAVEMIRLDLRNPAGWLHQAYALRRVEVGGLKNAFKSLAAASQLFPDEPLIAYNLACYQTQLGQLDEAWNWVLKAKSLLGKKKFLKLAMTDPDLEPLKERLRKI